MSFLDKKHTVVCKAHIPFCQVHLSQHRQYNLICQVSLSFCHGELTKRLSLYEDVTIQQGVQGYGVPLQEREASSLPSLVPRLPPQAAQARYLKSYTRI